MDRDRERQVQILNDLGYCVLFSLSSYAAGEQSLAYGNFYSNSSECTDPVTIIGECSEEEIRHIMGKYFNGMPLPRSMRAYKARLD